jgi:hypothetical protein
MKPFGQRLCLFLFLATLAIGHQACAGTDAPTGAAAKPALPKAIALSGQVMETMDGGGYTYVLLKNGAERVWVAIPLMKVSVGEDLTLVPGYEMKNFTSKGLNRKFDRLIFSAGPGNQRIKLSPSALKIAHEGMPANQPKVATSPSKAGAPAVSDASALKTDKVVPLSTGPVVKAKGHNSYTIAQLYAKKKKLEKKSIVVKGRVVKVTTRIMKRNWIHIKDGSGTEAKKNNDLIITSQDLPKEGDVVTAQGILYNDIDFGSGYRYSLILQGAQVK